MTAAIRPPQTPLSAQEARLLARLLCDTTERVLWQDWRQRIQQQRPEASLVCRVGSGNATYHRFHAGRQQHSITYGSRMVVAKFRAETAHGWLSSREIEARNYFGGVVSTRHLLAHTCCHEFAHLLQQLAGHRYRGSVHNRHFYRLLDDLHRDGSAEHACDYLTDAARHHGLPLPDAAFPKAAALVAASTWRVGDAVRFGRDPGGHQGIIQKVNRKTCTVLGTGPSKGLTYRVPFGLLRGEFG
ncbi:MAG: hypothetical protein R3280_03510 [Marinobacter sp.]|uniref:hypothetical protein n=1 Tax=Marinobacter sp. TaxID=50741 RepID=UPI00299D5D57|nr:hypothetical protein [Marinobacter sp.]MDX1633680.1 hypothetical protein [Marinobacter sp.]